VWLGDDFAHKAVRCEPPSRDEPSHGGMPRVISCGGAARQYVTLFGGSGKPHGLYVNEIIVYAPPSTAGLAVPAHSSPPQWGDVARDVNRRFEAGQPAATLSGGGVLYHVRSPWLPQCPHSPLRACVHSPHCGVCTACGFVMCLYRSSTSISAHASRCSPSHLPSVRSPR
jgi:hypothetical protein